MKNFILVILFQIFLFNVPTICSETIAWPSSLHYKNKNTRKLYFQNIAKRKNKGEKSPEIEYHIPNLVCDKNSLKDWGINWPYNGPLEKWVQRIITDLDNPEQPLRIIVPGCGKGRDLINFFVNTAYADITGIDISKDEKDYFENTLKELHITTHRLKMINQDFRMYLKEEITNNSIHFYYIVNFIHFFRRKEIKKMLGTIRNTLKNDGLVFLSWYGYDPNVQYNFSDENARKKQILESQYKNNIKDPGYIEQEERNYISLENMQKMAEKIGFCILHSKSYLSEYTGIDIPSLQKIIFFHYAFLSYSKDETLEGYPVCQMILGK